MSMIANDAAPATGHAAGGAAGQASLEEKVASLSEQLRIMKVREAAGESKQPQQQILQSQPASAFQTPPVNQTFFNTPFIAQAAPQPAYQGLSVPVAPVGGVVGQSFGLSHPFPLQLQALAPIPDSGAAGVASAHLSGAALPQQPQQLQTHQSQQQQQLQVPVGLPGFQQPQQQQLQQQQHQQQQLQPHQHLQQQQYADLVPQQLSQHQSQVLVSSPLPHQQPGQQPQSLVQMPMFSPSQQPPHQQQQQHQPLQHQQQLLSPYAVANGKNGSNAASSERPARPQKPWITPELLRIIGQKRENYRIYCSNPEDPDLKKEHVKTRKLAMKAVRKAKREHERKNEEEARQSQPLLILEQPGQQQPLQLQPVPQHLPLQPQQTQAQQQPQPMPVVQAGSQQLQFPFYNPGPQVLPFLSSSFPAPQ